MFFREITASDEEVLFLRRYGQEAGPPLTEQAIQSLRDTYLTQGKLYALFDDRERRGAQSGLDRQGRSQNWIPLLYWPTYVRHSFRGRS